MSEKGYINVLDDGPIVAEGLEKLTNSKGEGLEVKKKTALCRCGASQNKPYCDGAHKKIGFSSALEKDSSNKPAKQGVSNEIGVLKNGPYEVKGGMELTVKDEMGLTEDNPYYLCRCGASQNKPFCDGSHKEINFTDEKN